MSGLVVCRARSRFSHLHDGRAVNAKQNLRSRASGRMANVGARRYLALRLSLRALRWSASAHRRRRVYARLAHHHQINRAHELLAHALAFARALVYSYALGVAVVVGHFRPIGRRPLSSEQTVSARAREYLRNAASHATTTTMSKRASEGTRKSPSSSLALVARVSGVVARSLLLERVRDVSRVPSWQSGSLARVFAHANGSQRAFSSSPPSPPPPPPSPPPPPLPQSALRCHRWERWAVMCKRRASPSSLRKPPPPRPACLSSAQLVAASSLPAVEEGASAAMRLAHRHSLAIAAVAVAAVAVLILDGSGARGIERGLECPTAARWRWRRRQQRRRQRRLLLGKSLADRYRVSGRRRPPAIPQLIALAPVARARARSKLIGKCRFDRRCRGWQNARARSPHRAIRS